MSKKLLFYLASLFIATSGMAAKQEISRKSIPVPDLIPKKTSIVDRNDEKTKRVTHEDVVAPEGAPNVVVVLIDDVGYGMSSVMGGPINTPNAERLMEEGVLYNQFHTTSISSTTRVALLTGRNHHMNNMGMISEMGSDEPGYTGVRSNRVSTVAKILKLNGYNTSMWGKTHEIPAWEMHTNGDKTLWPTGEVGFDKFFGFIGGESDQFKPVLVDNTTILGTPTEKDYNLTRDLADKAIQWMGDSRNIDPEKPFFVYFAPGATHAPHQPPVEWLDKYKGQFDKGWDVLREETFDRQKKMGIIPEDTIIPEKPAIVKDWDKLNDTERKVFSRQMEVFAAYLEYADFEVGRIVNHLEETGELENTMFIYIIGDNGTSGEGDHSGAFNSARYFNMAPETIEEIDKHYDQIGKDGSESNFPIGWAVAGDTPFKWTKQVAADFGGTRNGMIVSWPAKIKNIGELRTQWSHVIDIAPTILDAANIPQPENVNGVPQIPMQGKSILATFNDNNNSSDNRTQYFEIAGGRGIYHNGWFLRTIHRYPTGEILSSLDKDKWELYDTRKDFALANDLSAEYPEKVAELRALFDKEAVDNYVYGIEDKTFLLLDPEMAGRPDLMGGRTKIRIATFPSYFDERAFVNTKNKSFILTTNIDVKTPRKTNGVIIASGGGTGGYSFYIKGGRPVFNFNMLELEVAEVKSKKKVMKGNNTIRVEFKYDVKKDAKSPKENMGRGGEISMYLNDELVGTGKISKTPPLAYSISDGVSIGEDTGHAVTSDYEKKLPFKFNEKFNWIDIEIFPGK